MSSRFRRAIGDVRRDGRRIADLVRAGFSARHARLLARHDMNRRIGSFVNSVQLVLMVLLALFAFWLHDSYETPVWILLVGWVVCLGLMLWLDARLRGTYGQSGLFPRRARRGAPPPEQQG